MNIPVETKPAIWGVVGGAVALAIIGFNWAGWTTSSTAETRTREQVEAAVVTALVPICVDRFDRGSDAAARLVELKKADYGTQMEFMAKGGWAAVPGSNSPDRLSAVARGCAETLSQRT